MSMELDDLKTTWQALDRKLEQQRTLSLQLIRDGKLAAARRGLRPLWLGQLAQIFAGLCLMLLFAPIWIARINTLHLMIPALLLHAYGLLLVLFAVRTLHLIGCIDYAAPVLRIQRQLAELRRWRTRVEWPLFGIVGCFIWIPLLLVIFSALGADLWALNPKFVYWNIASGAGCMGILYGTVRWAQQREKEGSGSALEKYASGRSIRKAQEELDALSRFEQE
jgi:hypothetical protein